MPTLLVPTGDVTKSCREWRRPAAEPAHQAKKLALMRAMFVAFFYGTVLVNGQIPWPQPVFARLYAERMLTQ
jgi:hypothetical protein